MSDLPFEIQSEIIKKLPVKSILQFRSVSKQWKSFIDCPEFIKTYHTEHPNPYHHLLVQYNPIPNYTSIIDDNTFPKQKFPLTAPEPLNSLRDPLVLGSVDGLLCYYGVYNGLEYRLNRMAVIWNPSVRKCVGIVIPNVFHDTRIAFGVCRDTNDPKLVKVNVVKTPSICWEVQVFSLSSRVWKTVYVGAPFKSCALKWNHVFVDGFVYWSTTSGDFIISFDLKNHKFGEVCLPQGFSFKSNLKVVKMNHSLGLLEYYNEGEMPVCGVWMRKDIANQPFTKIYTVKVEGQILFNNGILGFRNNGDVVLGILGDGDTKSSIRVYEPSSRHISRVGIKGRYSYMETLLLIDQSNSIIHS